MALDTNSLYLQHFSNSDKKLEVSPDGYVRLLRNEIRFLQLFHLTSCIDENADATHMDHAKETTITGYTEWIAGLGPAVTVGWDWKLEVTNMQIQYHRISAPRHNLMVCNKLCGDLGEMATLDILEKYIDSIDWQTSVRNFLRDHYS
jgi:hypothetical protein